jgi:hypothetical protein
VVVTLKSNNLGFLYAILLLVLFYAIPRFILICGIRVLSSFAESASGIRVLSSFAESAYGIRVLSSNAESASGIRSPVPRFIPTPNKSDKTMISSHFKDSRAPR